jgi:hypothetical protein
MPTQADVKLSFKQMQLLTTVLLLNLIACMPVALGVLSTQNLALTFNYYLSCPSGCWVTWALNFRDSDPAVRCSLALANTRYCLVLLTLQMTQATGRPQICCRSTTKTQNTVRHAIRVSGDLPQV